MDEGDGRDQIDRNEAISAVAEDAFMAEEEEDDYEDLYNDVNVGEGFLQSTRNNDEDKEEEKVIKTEVEDRLEPVLEAEVSIPGLVGESVAIEEEEETEAGGIGSGIGAASSGYGSEEHKVSDVSQQISGGGLRVELGKDPNQANDMEAPKGNNMSQGLLPPPPPPPALGNNENFMRPAMGNGNGLNPPGPGGSNMVGNGAIMAMPGAPTGGGGGGGGTFLFVGDLHWWTTDGELESELCKYGMVKEVKFFDEKATGKSKGYCQVEFYDSMAATACKEGMDGFAFSGRPCVVEYATPYSVKRMGEAQVNRSQQAQSALAQAKRGGPADSPSKPVVPNNNNAIGGNFQGGENRGFGRGNWGRGNAQGMGGRGPGGPMRNRPGGMVGRGLMGNGGGGFGQGMGTGPPMGMMHPQSMMGQGFEQAFGGPMARMGGYGGFPGAPGPQFPGFMPSFPPVGGVGLPGVAPHVNPAFFGRGMPMNGMGMMPNAGVDGGHNMGMWDPNSGGWGGNEDMGAGRAAESSYGEEAASDHQYGEVNHDRGARPNPVKEKDRASEREWSGSSDRRNREDKDAGYERNMAREKDLGHGYDMPEKRHRDDRDSGREREREHHHKDRERSRDRDRDRERERDRHREEREKYGSGDHRSSRHRDEPEHDDDWNKGRSSRGHSKSRLSREDNHRSRSRDADYGKRRRLTTE
ncbi:unnamed protein product [Cochlearia groenlandica]